METPCPRELRNGGREDLDCPPPSTCSSFPLSSVGCRCIRQVEWTTAPDFGVNETKLVTVLSDLEGDTDGRFRLRFGGEATYPLAHEASTADVREALEVLSTVADVQVSSVAEAAASILNGSESEVFGSSWEITFHGVTGPLPKSGYACTGCVSAISNSSSGTSAASWSISVEADLTGILREGDRVSITGHPLNASAYSAECWLLAQTIGETEIIASELSLSTCYGVEGPHAELALKFDSSSGLDIENVDLRSVSGEGTIAAFVMEIVSGTYPDAYGYAELRSDHACDEHTLGPSSSVQRLVLSAGSSSSPATTVIGGSYRLALGEHVTGCVAYNATPTELAAALQKLPSVGRDVSVFGRIFVDNGTYYPVGDEQLVVTDGLGYDYLIRFWGPYASRNGAWPQLRVPPEYFGRAVGESMGCETFVSQGGSVEPSARVTMLEQGASCTGGNPAAQVILAEALSALGGSFSLRHPIGEEVVVPLAANAAEMANILNESLGLPAHVTEARKGAYSKAWIVQFDPAVGVDDRLALCDRFATGTAAAVGVYDVVQISTSAARAEGMSGHFRVLINGEVSDLVSFSASDGRLDLVLQSMRSVGKVAMLSPVHLGGVGGVEVANVTCFNNSASVLAAGDLTKTVAPGDAVKIRSLDRQFFQVSSLSYVADSDSTAITLNHTVKELDSDNVTSSAVVGTAAISRSRLPGRARLASPVSVLYSYPNVESASRVLELSEGGIQALNISLNSTIVIGGQSYEVEDYSHNQVVLSRDFTGPTVSAGDVDLKVFRTSMNVAFTRDVSDRVSVGDKVWIENAHGDTDELVIDERITGTGSYRMSGLFSSEYKGASVYAGGNGRRWILAFKQAHADLDTFQLEPQSDWRGLGASVKVQRPGGVPPMTATLGSPSEVQTVALRCSQSWWSGMNKANNATWSLVLWPEDGPTAELAWGASSAEVEEALERLSGVSSVDVQRLGDGESAEWFYGYIYTLTFWGVHPSAGLPQLTLESSLSGVTAYVDTVRQGAAVAAQSPTLVSLKEGAAYSIRASAWSAAGYGPSSGITAAETPSLGVVPSHPTAVTLGACRYSSTSLGVQWQPPKRDGGQAVDGYRLEWDRSPSISESSAAYGTDYLAVTHEVQEVLLNFRSGDSVATRSGTFTISWGGHSTADLPWDSSAAALETAIFGISGSQELAANPIAVTRAPYRNGYKWTVTFMAWRGDVALLQGDGTLLVGDDPSLTFREKVKGGADIFPGDYTNEVQAITVTSLSRVSGSFSLAFAGKEIAPIAYDEGEESLKGKLEAIDALLCVDVKRFAVDGDLRLYSWFVTLAWLDGETVPGAGDLGLFTVASTAGLSGNGAGVGVFELVAGTNPLEYTIPSLVPGAQYFVHVGAHNSRGFGPFSAIATGSTRGQPDAPSDVKVSTAGGSTIAATWLPPADHGGAEVTGYLVEWYVASDPVVMETQMITTSSKKGTSEVQALSIKADSSNLGGYYTLSLNGLSTSNIAWDAPATGLDSIKEKLERLPGVGTVEVTQDYSKRAVPGLRVDLVAGSSNATVSNTSSLLPSQSGLVLDDIIFVAGYRARVLGFSPDGGSLLFGSMDNYATPDTFDQDFGAVGVTVEKWAYGYEYLITFTSYNGDAPLLEASGSDGWAGSNPVIDVEEVTAGIEPISGSFRLRFGGENTAPVSHDASAEDVESALEGLIDVGDVLVSRVVNGYGYNWIVTFVSEMGDVSLIEADGTGLTGPSASIAVSVGQDGILPQGYDSRELPDPSILHCDIGGLTLGEWYTVRVRAGNGEGYGPVAGGIPASIRPLEAPGPPEDVELIVLSNAMLKLVWSGPASDGGNAVSQYRVEWDLDEDFSNLATSGFYHIIPVGDEQGPFFYNIVIPAASSWLPRYARVKAYNSFSWGAPGTPDPASVLPALRPPGEPQDVELSVTSGAGLLVSWAAPSTDLIVYGGDGGSSIEEYLVEWDTSAKFDSPARRGVVTMPSALLYLIGGRDLMTGKESNELEPGVTYYVRVSAFNAQGYGAVVPTTPAYATTEDQVPEPPDVLRAETAGASSIAGVVGAPSRDGGDTLTAYRLEWDVDEDFSHVNGSSRAGGWEDVPFVRETQAFAVASSLGQEEQWIVATVDVTNERQTIRTQVR